MNKKRSIQLLIHACFLLSGSVGLVYEVVWERYLGIYVGHLAWVHSILLSGYLGGLALGAWALGRWVDRAKNPLRVYAYLELAVGLYGAASPYLITAAYEGLYHMGGSWSDGTMQMAQISLGYLLIVPPTFLMGGTLPALSRTVIDSLDQTGEGVGRLYFINSLGAVAGILIGAYWWVPTFGYDLSLTLAAIGNILAAAGAMTAMGLLKSAEGQPTPNDDRPAPNPERSPSRGAPMEPRAVRLLLGAIFLSGFLSLTYEVVWIRMLAMIFGSSIYSFSIMLAVFITGIAVGGGLTSLLVKPGAPTWKWFAYCQLGIAASMSLALPAYRELPFWFGYASRALSHAEGTFWIYQLVKFGFAFLVMFIPTVFIGFTLPLVTAEIADALQVMGKRVGMAYAAGTCGNVLGAVAAGLVLMPALGVASTMSAAIFGNLILGTVIFYGLRKTGEGQRATAVVAVAWIAALGVGVYAGDWYRNTLSATPYRAFKHYGSRAEYLNYRNRGEILYHEDGSSASVTVTQQGPYRTIYSNNKPEGSNALKDMITQTVIAHLPLLIHPSPKETLLIGMGTGITAGAMLAYPEVERLDMLEISGEMVEASKFFADDGGRPLEDPRMNAIVQDGKRFLLGTKNQYDVIVNEPSNPWIAGIGGLFTVEFFQTLQERLRPGGLAMLWIQCYEIDDEDVLMAIRSAREVFGDLRAFMVGPGYRNLGILVAKGPQPFQPDWEAMRRRFNQPETQRFLHPIKLRNPEALLMTETFTPSLIATIQDGPLNADRNPRLEYSAPKSFFHGKAAQRIFESDARLGGFFGQSLWLFDYWKAYPPTPESLDEAMDYLHFRHETTRLIRSLAAYRDQLADQPLDAERRIDLGIEGNPAAPSRTLAELRSMSGPAADLTIRLEWELQKTEALTSAFYRPDLTELEKRLTDARAYVRAMDYEVQQRLVRLFNQNGALGRMNDILQGRNEESR